MQTRERPDGRLVGLGHMLLAALAVLVALGLALALAPVFNDAPVPLFLTAVLLSAWVGGLWPGLLATGLGALVLGSLFNLSRASPLPPAQDTAFDLFLFAVVGCLISSLTASLRSSNRRLDAARKQAEAALGAREDFMAAAAHDLKSPLTGIMVTAQLARRRLGRLSMDNAECSSVDRQLRDIEAGACRITEVLDELLDLAQLQAESTLRLTLAPTHLLALVENAVATHQARTEHHTLRVIANANPVGRWDASRLARVLDNLLSNAIKYSPAGGEITLEVAEERASAGARVAVVRVSDHGLGIPAADLERIFERFVRGGNVGHLAGTGIGLAGARQIVERHGGSLTVDSREGAGSTFSVRLPL